jgi:hypothetical protein
MEPKMAAKVYDLLSIDVVSSLRSRMFFKREESSNSYSLHLNNGLSELKSRMKQLIQDGVCFHNCIFTGHGNSGVISLGPNRITRKVWYEHFYPYDYHRLFPFPNARIYFGGCNVAEDPHGWAFLAAAARSLCRGAGGSAFGWTSVGFGSPISGHERHLWGDTKSVMVSQGGKTLRYYRNWKLIEENGEPSVPEEAIDDTVR